MKVAEYSTMDGTELAQAIRDGDVTAEEVHKTARAAIIKNQPALNAIVDGPWDRPLEYSKDGPMSGVPFVLKDLGQHAAGVAVRSGSHLTGQGTHPARDSQLMRDLKSAGLAALGVAASDEFGAGANTSTLRFGAVLNPWDTRRSPGGSSGGSASLVASGAVPVAHASDAGGSIRIPASVTGVVGMKPSRGRTASSSARWTTPGRLATDFVLTRSIRDCSSLYDCLSNLPSGRVTNHSSGDSDWKSKSDRLRRGLRIAYSTEAWGGQQVESRITSVIHGVVAKLEDSGHYLYEARPKFSWDSFQNALQVLNGVSTFTSMRAAEDASGLRLDETEVQPILRSYYELGRGMNAIDLWDALVSIEALTKSFEAFFRNFDVLVTPNTTICSWTKEELDPQTVDSDARSWMNQMFDTFCFSPAFNATGEPAMSLPLGRTESGFPIGVQIAAGIDQDRLLLLVAGQLEESLPWDRFIPPLHASREV